MLLAGQPSLTPARYTIESTLRSFTSCLPPAVTSSRPRPQRVLLYPPLPSNPRKSDPQTINLQYALIGAGIMGSGDAESALKVPGVKLVAVADIYEGRLERAKERWGKDLFTTRDYREVLARPDIDAVIIGTPDHWHAPISIDAMNAGKDVYCEKPMVQKPEDGIGVIETHKKTGRIMQIGSQGVSSVLYQKAKDLIQSGAIGQLNMVEAWWDRNSPVGAWQYAIPPDASPQTIDWDRFLGSAPKRAVRAHPPVPLAQLQGLRNRRDRRPFRPPVLGHALHPRLASDRTRSSRPEDCGTGKTAATCRTSCSASTTTPQTASTRHSISHCASILKAATDENSGIRFRRQRRRNDRRRHGLHVSKQPREKAPGYTIDTFPKDVQEQFKKEYFAKYPVEPARADAIRPKRTERVRSRRRATAIHVEHHRNLRRMPFAPASRSWRIRRSASVPPDRRVLSNLSYSEKRVVRWDPESDDGGKRDNTPCKTHPTAIFRSH